MRAHPVNTLVPAPKGKNPQVKAIPLFVLITFLLSTSTCPAQTEVKGESMPPDSLSALFEDIYGRFPNAATYGLHYVHAENRSDGASAFTFPAVNNAVANFTLGDRRSYQLSAGFRNNALTSYYPSQAVNLGLTVRPDASWQFSGAGYYGHRGGTSSTDYLNLSLSTDHLSGGGVEFNESTLRQYYYFSNLFLRAGQVEFSFAPTYNGMPNSENGLENYTINSPVSLMYGLSDRITGGVNAYFYRSSFRSPSTAPSGTVGSSGTDGWEYQLGFEISYLADNNNAVAFGVNWYNNRWTDNYLSIYSNGYVQQQTRIDNRSFADLSASWHLSFLDKPISVYDLRRSYYTGNYLHTGEATNGLKITYSSKSNTGNGSFPSSISFVKTTIADSLVVGLNDILEFSAKGEVLEGYSSSANWARYGLAQLTFHNLRYSGSELSDFDYFFGRINTPGDYSLTVAGSLASDESYFLNEAEPNKEFQVDGRIGIIDGLDGGIVYSYSKYDGTFSSSSSSWRVTARANLLKAFRVECSTLWGNNKSSAGGSTSERRGLNIQASVSALF